jgi:hypothetical protein
MKYALIVDNKVVQISYPYVDGYVQVDDNVFADMIKKSDGTFDYTDEFKSEHIKTKTYRDYRAKDYPSLADQLDMQYWDKINGTNKWQQAINAVKQKYPK